MCKGCPVGEKGVQGVSGIPEVVVYHDLSDEEKKKLEEERVNKIRFNKNVYFFKYELDDYIKDAIRTISKKPTIFLNMLYAYEKDKIYFSVTYGFIKRDRTISKSHHRFCYFDLDTNLFLGSIDDDISKTKFRRYDKESLEDFVLKEFIVQEVSNES